MNHTTQGLPKVLIVGDPRIADIFANSGAQWHIQPAAPNIDAMWDAIENGTLDGEATVAVFTEGTAANPDDLAATILAFTPYSDVFLIAQPTTGQQLLLRAQELAPSIENSDPTKPIWLLPITNVNEALNIMRKVLAGKIAWNTPVPPQPQPTAPQPTQQQPLTPPPGAPAPQPPTTQTAQPTAAYNPQLSGATPDSLQMRAYEQSQIYAEHVIQQASTITPKPPNAIPGQMTIACMSSKGGSGKCAGKNSIVFNPFTGIPRTIEDLVLDPSTEDMALAFDGRFISAQKIGEKFVSGEKETFTVTLRSGRTVSATANHPLLTTDGWRNLEDVQVGETLAVPSRVPFPLEPRWMDASELDLLAAILAEGGTSQRNTGFTSNDPSIVKIVSEAAMAMGLSFKSHGKHPMQYGLSGVIPVDVPEGLCSCGCGRETESTIVVDSEDDLNNNQHRHTADHVLRRFRREHGLDFVLAKNKKMPEAVYRLPAEQLSRFLAVFWMCDGYVSAKGGGDVGITLASKELVKAFQHLLLRFGILSTFRHKKAKAGGKEFDAWRVTVHAGSFPAFSEFVPLWGEKREALDVLLARGAGGKGNPNVGCPTFSDELYDRIVSFDSGKSLPRVVCEALGWNVSTHASPSMVLTHRKTRSSGRKHLNLNGLRLWCEAAGVEAEREFGWIYDSEIYWDEVVSVVSDGVQRVYDIEIPSVHNFVADDVIVHNSTTALCLAGTIAKASAAAGNPKRVVLVDLDTRDGQVASLIGKYMPTSINIRVMPRWDAETVKKNLVHDPKLGIDALLAPIRPRNADDVGPEFYKAILGILQTTHDVVVLDCSVNYLDPLLGTAFAMADEILFVTTLATTSVQGMARSLTELFADPSDGGLGIPREKVGIVANQVMRNVGMGKDKLLRAALGAPLVGQIPSDQDAVLIATNQTKMHKLLEHPRLGPAYFDLARQCLPDWDLAPITVAQVEAIQAAAVEHEEQRGGKKGFFRR